MGILTGCGPGCEVPTCNFPAGKQQKSSPLTDRAGNLKYDMGDGLEADSEERNFKRDDFWLAGWLLLRGAGAQLGTAAAWCLWRGWLRAHMDSWSDRG